MSKALRRTVSDVAAETALTWLSTAAMPDRTIAAENHDHTMVAIMPNPLATILAEFSI
jgi:hypothetical protein